MFKVLRGLRYRSAAMAEVVGSYVTCIVRTHDNVYGAAREILVLEKVNDCRRLKVYIRDFVSDVQQPIIQINGYGFQRELDLSKALAIAMRYASSGLHAIEFIGCPSINLDLLKALPQLLPGLQTVTVHDSANFDLEWAINAKEDAPDDLPFTVDVEFSLPEHSPPWTFVDDSECRDLYTRCLEARPLIGMVQWVHNVAMLGGILRRQPTIQHCIMQWFNLSEKRTGRDVPKLVLEHALRISDLREALSGTKDKTGKVVEGKALKNFKRQHVLHALGRLARRLQRHARLRDASAPGSLCSSSTTMMRMTMMLVLS
ncbi:unnamed protein product [Cercospora beticola]|nr:unnamed protein product [Cercospora beticola]